MQMSKNPNKPNNGAPPVRNSIELRHAIFVALAVVGLIAAVMENEGFTFEVLHHLARATDNQRTYPLYLMLGLHAGLWGWALSRGGLSFGGLARAVWPLAILCGNGALMLLGLSSGMLSLYASMLLMGLCATRVMQACPRETNLRLPTVVAWILALLACLYFVYWMSFFLEAMHERLLLGYSDIGIYYKRLLNSVRYGAYLQVYSELPPFWGHFSPGLILLVPLFACLPTIKFLILTQTIVLGGTSLLLMFLARRHGLSALSSLALAICYLLYPSTSQVAYNFSYGFNPNTLALPFFVAGGYCLLERRHVPATILLVLGLSMKEYLAIYIVGLGIMLALHRRWRTGAIMAAGGILYFVLISFVFMPWHSQSAYDHMARGYSTLGNSLGDVVLAPLTRPGSFFSLLCAPANFSLVLELLLPMGCMCLLAPRVAIAVLPVLGMSWLHQGQPFKSIAFHYHVCTMGILFLALIRGISRRDEPLVLPWQRLQARYDRSCAWIRRIKPGAAITGALIAAVYASLFLSLFPWAKQNVGIVPSNNQLMQNYLARRDIVQLIPADATVTGDGRSICQFLDRRLSRRFQFDPYFETDYHVYQERFWNSNPSVARAQVEKIMASGAYEVIYQQHGVHVLKRINPLPPPPGDLF